MKRLYIKPDVVVEDAFYADLICSSITGVTGTGNLNTTVSSDETDEYLSRKGTRSWVDEEEEYE